MQQDRIRRLTYFLIGGFALIGVVLYNTAISFSIHLLVYPHKKFPLILTGSVCHADNIVPLKTMCVEFGYLLAKLLLIPICTQLLRRQKAKAGMFVLLMSISDLFILPLKILDPTGKFIADLLFSDCRLYFLSYHLFRSYYVLPGILGATAVFAQIRFFRDGIIPMPLFWAGLLGLVCAIFGGGFIYRVL